MSDESIIKKLINLIKSKQPMLPKDGPADEFLAKDGQYYKVTSTEDNAGWIEPTTFTLLYEYTSVGDGNIELVDTGLTLADLFAHKKIWIQHYSAKSLENLYIGACNDYKVESCFYRCGLNHGNVEYLNLGNKKLKILKSVSGTGNSSYVKTPDGLSSHFNNVNYTYNGLGCNFFDIVYDFKNYSDDTPIKIYISSTNNSAPLRVRIYGFD